MFLEMLCGLRLQLCVDLCVWGLVLLLAGLQQVEAAASASAEEMPNLNWKPFIYGGMASIVAEFGELGGAHSTHTRPPPPTSIHNA